MKTKTPPVTNSVNPATAGRGLLLSALVLACLALSATVRAVDPPPDGGYPDRNTAEGEDALFSLTTGTGNTAVGFHALYNNTSAGENTAIGTGALARNLIGSSNTANGFSALFSNISGSSNTANGMSALFSNTIGFNNTATGANALSGNTVGYDNTATGTNALSSNTIGFDNTAIGTSALSQNTEGLLNTATGANALNLNTTGGANTAIGRAALSFNTTGNDNTAVGYNALDLNTTGNDNTSIGLFALSGMHFGDNNIAVGANAGFNLNTGDNNIFIGNPGRGFESNTIRIGTTGTQTATVIAGIRDVTTGNRDAIPVLIDSVGQLGTMSSSRRFKKEIKPMDQTSEVILGLKPVTFHYKSDSKGTLQFGLIAEEVAQVNPDLVVRDKNGEIYTVRYDAVNAMLLNEFLKEHRTVQEQAAKITQQRNDFEAAIAQQQKQIDALTAALQKVSAQLELSKSAPQTVLNNH